MPIWRLIADDRGKWVAIELRDVVAYNIEYITINLENIELFKQDFVIEDMWWTGIFSVQNDKLIINKFNKNDSPEEKSFFIVNILTKEICYQLEGITINGISTHEIYGYKEVEENQRSYKRISLNDYFEQEITQKEFNQKIEELIEKQNRNKATTYPFHYPETHAYFKTVMDFLRQLLQVQVVKGCDYLEQENAIIISYYIYEENALTNYLLVLNHEQELILHEKIGSQLEGIGTDTFFIAQNRLIFIKEKYQLIGYALDNVQ